MKETHYFEILSSLLNTAQLCQLVLLSWEIKRDSHAPCRVRVDISVSMSCLLYTQELKYFVDAPSKAKTENQSSDNAAKLELLKGITGYSAPGVLTALMGGSGQSPRCSLLPMSFHHSCSVPAVSCALLP